MSRKKRKLRALRAKEEQGREQGSHRRLTQGLIFSGALNIALFTSLVFYVVKSRETSSNVSQFHTPHSTLALDLPSVVSLQKTLDDYLLLDFESLTALLRQNDLLEEGMSKRDLALSLIAYKYNFDVQRALLGQEIETKSLSLDEKESIPLYCGLGDAQYKLILSFLKTEQWPFTSEGLFNRLIEGQSEESLKNAFYLTREFMLIDALLGPLSVAKEDLLGLLKQGPWELVDQFVSCKPKVQSFSNPLRIQFLCQYLDNASHLAAELILKTDPDYALKKLSDEKLVMLLGLLENKSELTQNFVLHLALGSRSTWVKQEACRLLYHYSNKEFKHPFNYEEALHFIAQEYDLRPAEASVQMPVQTHSIQEVKSSLLYDQKTFGTYTVQKGDCLSKIAKQHHIEISALKAANNLENDLIQVGMTLKIP